MIKKRFKLLFYVLITFSVLSCKEVKPQVVTFNTYIDEELKVYVDEFVSEGKKRGFDATPYIKIIDSIKINPDMEYGYLGLYTPTTHPKFKYFYGTIDISELNIINSKLLRSTVFHELAHACGYRGHPCDSCPNILSSKTSINMNYYRDMSLESWYKQVDILFLQIKSIPKESNYIREYIKDLN